MKRALPILLTVWTTTFVVTTSATAAPVNGSFESGSLEGWRLEMPRGYSTSSPHNRSAGTSTVASDCGLFEGLNLLRTPVRGNEFVALGTLANGNFTGNRTYNISLNQELSLTAGETVTGWSFFFNGDFESQDSAWVKVSDHTGNPLATPWQENSGCDFISTALHSATPWTQWFWQAPESGSYMLSLGVTTHGDDNYASYGFFDDIFTIPPTLPVPEPSTFGLVAIGAAILAHRRRKQK